MNSQLVRTTSALNSKTTFHSDMILIKVFAFPLSWLFWALGDFTYNVLELFDDHDQWCAFWYPIYNYLMIASDKIQSFAGGSGEHWPWSDLKSD